MDLAEGLSHEEISQEQGVSLGHRSIEEAMGGERLGGVKDGPTVSAEHLSTTWIRPNGRVQLSICDGVSFGILTYTSERGEVANISPPYAKIPDRVYRIGIRGCR